MTSLENYLNQVIGSRYEIQEIIGVGGMACVYKAYDRVDDRTVAVKILKDEFLANADVRNRFKNESQAISVLSHPNIVKVYDFFFSDTLQYIVMEYVDGITLKDYIKQQNVLSWNIAVHFIVQILRALQHAHDKGIIHRDIKPENIILLPNASLKVTDFGIARFNRSGKNSAGEYRPIGSVHYVSPEQARGEYTDEKSDIYSVGVVLYEMLTGKKPFDSEKDEVVAAMQLQAEAVKPTKINPSIPLGLEQITLRAMQKNADDRYQSASEFLADINEFKRNPAMQFDYSYLNETPTKYLEYSSMTKNNYGKNEKDKKSESSSAARRKDSVQEDDEDEENDGQRSSTLSILLGIAVSLVLVIVLIGFIVFGGTINDYFRGNSQSSSEHSGSFLEKIDIFGWFNKDKIEVPNFINMTFDEVLKKYPEYAIENPPQYEYNSRYEDGHVCKQYPDAGVMVSKDTVFKLTVATNNQMVLVRDVSGLPFSEAETILKASGLNVELVPVADKNKKNGDVLYTEPNANTYTEYMGVVYVYYASSSDSTKTVIVPDVRGDELEVAKKKIIAAGLTVGSVTEGPSEPSLKGFVISQSPGGMISVKEGTVVSIIVGNGVSSTSTAVFRIFLPSLPGGPKGNIKIILNDKPYDSISDVVLDGSAYKISIIGKGAKNSFKIYIDDKLIYTGDIDFTASPPNITNVINYQSTKKVSVPSVTGLTESAANSALTAAGFTRIRVIQESSASVPAGTVISQSPEFSLTDQYLPTITVTLIVSTGPSADDTTASDENTTTAENTTAEIETTEEITEQTINA